jgi:hypothetical protein
VIETGTCRRVLRAAMFDAVPGAMRRGDCC